MKYKFYLSIIFTVLLISGAFAWQTDLVFAVADNPTDNIVESAAAIFGSPEYVAIDEFSLTQSTGSTWQYGFTADPASDNFVPFPISQTVGACSSSPGSAFQIWANPNPNDAHLGRNVTGAPFICGSLRVPTDAIYMHPGENGQRSVVRWKAPIGGTYQVTGVFEGVNSGYREARILKNGNVIGSLSNIVIDGYGQRTFDFNETVAAGDTIDFSLGWGNGTWNSDGTGLSVSIGEPITTCMTAPANLQVNVPGESSPSDVQSPNTNAQLIGNATYTVPAAGKVGRAFQFDGDGDYVRIDDNAAQKSANQITVEGWFKFNNFNNYPYLVSKPLRISNYNSYAVWYDGSLRIGYYDTAGTWYGPGTGYQPQIGTWTHYAMVINTDDTGPDANTMKLYVNGVEYFSGPAGGPIFYNGINDAYPAHPLLIGGEIDSENTYYYLNGGADEVSIYGRALTSAEIFDIVQQGSYGKCPPATQNPPPPLPVVPPANQTAWFTGDGNTRNFTGLTPAGTLGGDTTYRLGRVGQAFKLDGNGDYVSTVDSNYWDFGTGDFAIESWINTPSGTGVQRIISSGSQADGANNLWSLGYGDICAWGCGQRLNLAVFNGGGYTDFSSDQISIRPNTWHHVAVVRSTTSITFYFDGVTVGTRAVGAGFALNGGSTGAIIGARYNANPSDRFEFANGMLDEITIYDRAVTSGEIASVLNAGVAGKRKTKNTFAGTNDQTQISDATVTFANITVGGTVSQNGIDLGMMPPLPPTATYTGLGYNIATTATYQSGTADDVQVCFNIPSLAGTPIAALRVLQLVGNTWINRTAAGNSHSSFCTDNVSSLSQFVIVQDSATALYTVSGRVTNSNGFGISGVWVEMRDATTVYGNVPTDANGDYAWTNAVGGETYTFTPILANTPFTPASRTYTNISGNITGANFTAQATNQCLAANYEFQDNLNSTGVTAPPLSYIGTGQSFATETVNGQPTRVLTYPGGNAVELRPTSGVLPSNQYEITIVTRFNQTYNYNRILDFKDGTTDGGLYVTSGQLIFLGGASGGPSIPAGVFVEIKLTRTAAGIVKGYVNGVEQFTFNDTSGAAIISPANALRFFKDDGGENYGGSISKIQLSSGGCGTTNSIAGHISEGAANLSGVSVAISGGVNASTTTDANGNYTFANLPSGLNYTVTPTLVNVAFTPETRTYNALAANITDANFTGTNSCTFAADPDFSQYTAAAGSGSFNIVTQPGCQWTAAPDANAASWVTLTSSGSGSGNGTVSYSVAANSNILRIGQILVNGNATAHTIGQATGTGTCPTVTPITYGTTLNGALAGGDCSLSGRFTDQYSFSGTVGDRVMIRFSSTDFAESIILHNAANTTIYTVVTGGAAGDARVPNSYGFYTLPATGTYIISASNWGNGGSPTGNYALTLHSDRTVPGVTPPSGLIGWYAGDGDTRNQQGNSPGTFNGTATYLTDYAGQSFSLNGTDQYVEVPSTSEAFNVSSLSVEAWVNTTTTTGNRTIASKFNGAGGASWSLDMESGGALIFTVFDGTTANFRAVRASGAAALLTANEWKHVAATFDQTTQAITIYVNGTDAGTLVAGSASNIGGVGQNSVPLRIGAKFNGSMQGFWQGRLDEVSVYNRAITSAEVIAIVDAGRIGKIKQAALNNQTTATLGTSTINFAVATTGTATETPIDGSALPATLPSGNNLQMAFNISTTAPFSGNATVCFAVPSVTPATFAGLKVFHFEGGVWVDRTASGNVYPTLCALTPSFSPFAIAGPLAPSAAEVSVGGRVTTANGRGISGAIISLSDANGVTRTARTGGFGYYQFENVTGGENYVISIRSKRFTFADPVRIVNTGADATEVDFVSNE